MDWSLAFLVAQILRAAQAVQQAAELRMLEADLTLQGVALTLREAAMVLPSLNKKEQLWLCGLVPMTLKQ